MQENYYPTASTTAVFLNGLHIDQAYRIDYKDSIPKIPIFGYNDYEFTQVARGKGFVQGLLIINFTVPFYLTSVISEKTSAFVPRLYNYQIDGKVDVSKNTQYKDKLKQTLKYELPPNSDPASRKARAEYIASLMSNQNKATKEKTKEALYDFFEGELSMRDAETSKDVDNPLTLYSKTSAGNTIDVYYSDPSDSSWFIRFNDVHFYDISQQASQAGAEGSSENLYEIYSFLAKSRSIRLLN